MVRKMMRLEDLEVSYKRKGEIFEALENDDGAINYLDHQRNEIVFKLWLDSLFKVSEIS